MKLRSPFAITILFLLLGATTLQAQQPKVKNLPTFDRRTVHFGFSLGYNSAGQYFDLKEGLGGVDSLVGVTPVSKPGFDLGIISSFRFSKNFTVRFLPALSFQDRELEYRFLESDSSFDVIKKRIGSTFIDFPLNIKFRTDRVNNFAAYLIGGAKYSIDMTSDEDVNNQSGDNVVVRFKRNDFAGQVGAGMDFFLKYFKFGIELKLSAGFNDLLIHDDTRFSRPIDGTRTRLYLLSLTFEG